MIPQRLLVAGIGNIFLGDDAFGVEVAQRLLRRTQRRGVKVVDFGIRGLDLTYALLDGWDAAILIDAVQRGQPPGTLFVLEPQLDAETAEPAASPIIEAHSMDPARVLRTVKALGVCLKQVFIVGCEPSPDLPDDEMAMGVSDSVRAAIDEAVALVESLIGRLLDSGTILPSGLGPLSSTDAAALQKEMQHGNA